MTDNDRALLVSFPRHELTVNGEETGVETFASRHGFAAIRLEDKPVGAARRDVASTHHLHAIKNDVRLLRRSPNNPVAAPWIIQMPLQVGQVATWNLIEEEPDEEHRFPFGLLIAIFAAAGALVLVKVIAHLLP